MKKHSYFYILAIMMFSMILGCGSGAKDPYATGGEGSVTMKVIWVDAPLLQASGIVKATASLDCSAAGVSKIEAKIFDSVGNTIGTGGPWDCSTHTATISKVPAGGQRKAVLAAKDASGVLRYWGEQSGVTINADVANNINITASPFVTSTVTPTAGNGQVTLNWGAVTGATSYNIYWATSSGVNKSNGNKLSSNTKSYSHSGLTNGTTYYYVVTAVNSFGEGPESSPVVSGTPSSGTPPACTYTYSDWGTCQNGTQTRTVISATPQGCTGTPVLTQTCSVFLGIFKLPDTGQGTCFQVVAPYAEIPCAGTGQDGAYTINPLSYTDNGNGTFSDNVTGLMWQMQYNGQKYNWYQAAGVYEAAYNANTKNVCGELRTGGYSDWRLPSERELVSIAYFGSENPAPVIEAITHCTYWSTDKYTDGTSFDYPRSTYLPRGDTGYHSYTTSLCVLCVRGNQVSGPILRDNHNGTVTDSTTGLMWQQRAGSGKWGDALSYCNNLRLPDDPSGYTDWRLPNIKELHSLFDFARFPSIDFGSLPNSSGYYIYLSSTTESGGDYFVWVADFYPVTTIFTINKLSDPVPIRCVRGGQ